MNENNVIQLLEHMGRSYRRSRVHMNPLRVERIRLLLVQELERKEDTKVVREPQFGFSWISSFFQIPALRPVIAILVLSLFGVGSLLKIASASLPGDRLYTVKLVREEALVRLTSDEEERAKLAVQRAVRRADEVKQVVHREESRERKVERLSVAVAGLTKHVAEATETLVAAKEKQELASAVEEGANEIVSLLSEAREEAAKSNGVVAAEVERALSTVVETRTLVELTTNPPTALAQSVVTEESVITSLAPVVQKTSVTPPSLVVRKRVSEQSAALAHPAQSVFSLPIAVSVTSKGNLPFAVSVNSSP